MLRVLVGTLYSGEREYDTCLEALRNQRYMLHRHFVIEHLPEKAAHDQLYQRFMEHAHGYELFFKLDADMVLADENRLGAAVAIFEQQPHLDHAVFTVHDWMTDSTIVGLNMYRSRVQWAKRDGEPFADAPPQITGQRRCIRRPPSPLALHSPDPSPAQAFHYGLHRGLKAFQIGLERLRPVHARAHWRLLKRLWRNFDRRLDPRMGLALLGVEHVLTHQVRAVDCNYTNPRFWRLLDLYMGMDPLQMHEHLRPMWAARLRREVVWGTTIGRQLVRRHRQRKTRPPETQPL